MRNSIRPQWFYTFLMLCAAGAATANKHKVSAAAKRFFGMQTTAVLESLIAGFYGIKTAAP